MHYPCHWFSLYGSRASLVGAFDVGSARFAFSSGIEAVGRLDPDRPRAARVRAGSDWAAGGSASGAAFGGSGLAAALGVSTALATG